MSEELKSTTQNKKKGNASPTQESSHNNSPRTPPRSPQKLSFSSFSQKSNSRTNTPPPTPETKTKNYHSALSGNKPTEIDQKKLQSNIQPAKMTMEQLQAAADQGNPEAQISLAVFYKNSKGAEANIEKAVQYYKMAADNKTPHAEAQYWMGIFYFQQWITTKNNAWLTKSVDYYNLAATQGHSEAQFALGKCYEFEDPVQNYEKAAEWYSSAKAEGVILLEEDYAKFLEKLDQHRLQHGFYYLYQIPQSLITQELLQLHVEADKNDLQTQSKLAEYYFNLIQGKLTKEEHTISCKMAVRYAELVARKNIPRAQYIMGYLCFYGLGITKNTDTARHYLTNAAAQDFPEAVKLLSTINNQKMEAANIPSPKNNMHYYTFNPNSAPLQRKNYPKNTPMHTLNPSILTKST
jgi:TPR repeat protein